MVGADLFPRQTHDGFYVGAAGEQVGSHCVFKDIASGFQQSHIPRQGRRIAGNINDPPGRDLRQRFDGIGIQALSGGIDDGYINANTLFRQRQRCFTGIAAEKFCIFNAVALCIVFGIGYRLGDHLHANDLACSGCHRQSDGADTAVKIQNGVSFRDACQLDGGLVQPLGLMMVDLIERPGGKAEG